MESKSLDLTTNKSKDLDSFNKKFFTMNLFQAFILGIVQGLTEYIPVSSSAHLVVVPWLLGWPKASEPFEILIQWGTLIGVLIFLWQDVWLIAQAVIQGLIQRKPLATFEAKLGWLIVVATIPAVILGATVLKGLKFSDPYIAGSFLMVTAILLILTEQLSSRKKTVTGKDNRNLKDMTWLDALIIGFWQAFALLPGVSRSGATISGIVLQGFDRTAAARFSFLMSIPVLLGAGLIAIKDLLETGSLTQELPAISVGFVAAGISGYLCVRWLLTYLQKHSLYVFAAYCVFLSLLTIMVGYIRG